MWWLTFPSVEWPGPRWAARRESTQRVVPCPGGTSRARALLYRPAVPITIRPVTADELLPWFQQLATTFFIWPIEPEGSTKMPWATKDLDRRIGAFDGERIVATYRTFATELTLPGGTQVQASAVSAVSTRPTHRR